MDDSVFTAALAGLLHDVGKVAQRAGKAPPVPDQKDDPFAHPLLSEAFIQEYVPAEFQGQIVSIRHHHRPEDKLGRILQEADQLASGWNRAGQNVTSPNLEAVLSKVQLAYPAPHTCFFPITALKGTEALHLLDRVDDDDTARNNYAALWLELCGEMKNWQGECARKAIRQDADAYFTTLLALLKKYLSFTPASTGWLSDFDDPVEPDVSLYEHSRLVSAIAACLSRQEQSRGEDNPVALILRGDVSGIQKFIYRITEPGAESRHTAKRLRGRSFYLAILAEVVVDWLLRAVGMPPNCALFVGGGRFDLLLPVGVHEQVLSLISQLETWLLDEFQGELGIQTAFCEVRPADFRDMRSAYLTLEEGLEESKRRKWAGRLEEKDFFQPPGNPWHACRVCQLKDLPGVGICDLCLQHSNIGQHLPHATHLAFCSGQVPAGFKREQVISFQNSPFDAWAAVICAGEDLETLAAAGVVRILFQLNRADGFIQAGIASSFRFLANEAPQARESLHYPDGDIAEGEVLHYEAIADLGEGARRLGVLKADVDHMGLVMSTGLEEDKPGGLRPTLARTSALSSSLDLFFAGEINWICKNLFLEWEKYQQSLEQKQRSRLLGRVGGLFYVVYSGGDDLFIAGPWDQTLLLARRLNEEFTRFCGGNSNVTLSAGFVQVKPRFPIQKFAELVDEAEKKSKGTGRNRVTAFNETVPWGGGMGSYTDLLDLADDLKTRIRSGQVSRGLAVDLGRLHRQHLSKSGRGVRLFPMWTPRLYYSLARRIKADPDDPFVKKLVAAMGSMKILVPVSIVSLKNREE
jgi:CRISPR-associated protein Csm1